ncbi:MAG: hypothetical protein AAGE52_04735 [Myxococcota bacterium]
MRILSLWVALAFVLASVSGCGGDDDGGGTDASTGRDVPEGLPPASLAQLIAFEGHQTHVNEVTLSDGTSLEGAVISPAPGSPFEVREQRCTPERCGVVLAVRDETANRGVSIPSPIDAENQFLDVRVADGRTYRGLLSLQPLDALSATAGSSAAITQPFVLASSLTMESGSTFLAGGTPIRWVVFGDATVDGTFDFSPGDEPRGGGARGGAAREAGQGASGGQPGTSGAGGGGGAGREAGETGRGSDGAADGGGTGGAPLAGALGACLSDPARTDCGGSGGGGADAGEGGAGGGAFLLATLGRLEVAGTLRASGGSGSSGGGGGGGGQLLVAAQNPSLATGNFVVTGGDGEGPGGRGGDGEVRFDGNGDSTGISIDLSALGSPIRQMPTVAIGGVAPDGSTVEIRRDGSVVGSGAASPEFTAEVTLVEGLNRLAVVARTPEGELRSWAGNSIELIRVDGSPQPLPLGATVDVVYCP